MKARNDKGEMRGQRGDTLGMLINEALGPKMRAHIRAGLRDVQRRRTPSEQRSDDHEGK